MFFSKRPFIFRVPFFLVTTVVFDGESGLHMRLGRWSFTRVKKET
jgi:hypothetical protein